MLPYGQIDDTSWLVLGAIFCALCAVTYAAFFVVGMLHRPWRRPVWPLVYLACVALLLLDLSGLPVGGTAYPRASIEDDFGKAQTCRDGYVRKELLAEAVAQCRGEATWSVFIALSATNARDPLAVTHDQFKLRLDRVPWRLIEEALGLVRSPDLVMSSREGPSDVQVSDVRELWVGTDPL